MRLNRLKCNYCGHVFLKRRRWWFYLRFLFKDHVYLYCPVCGRVSSFILCVNVVHDTIDPVEKEVNSLLAAENERRDKS